MSNITENKVANRIRWGYLTAFILLLSSYVLSYYTAKQLIHQTELVSNTNNIINSLDKLLSDIKDAEGGLRGFYLSGDERFLDPYKNSQKNAEANINRLTHLAKPEMGIDSLRYYINKKYQVMASGLNAHIFGSFILNEEQKSLLMEGKRLMDIIRAKIAGMEQQATKNMNDERREIIESSNSIKIINFASLVVATLLAVYSIITFNKENRARQEADTAAATLRTQLEERVDELNHANQELVELKSLEKFAVTGRISRTIAHEVRNPLTNINLATEHLRTELPQSDEIDVLLEMISRNANRINVLISDLLNSTRAAHLNFESASITDLLDESLALAQDRIKLNNIKVIRQYHKNGCDLIVDPEKIKIAFLNIIVNAIEAMDPERGVLRLSTQVADGKCTVTIADNGKGMDKESVSKLFEPYFTTKESGTGLGLTNTHNIIINHKAGIQASSEPGKGTTFRITFNLPEADTAS